MPAYDYGQVWTSTGWLCPQCRTLASPTRVEIGPRIGHRTTFKCLQGHKFQAQRRAS